MSRSMHAFAARGSRKARMHLETIDEPALFFAPFVSSTMAVEPQWIDYNGHMNMAYYLVLFDRAVDEAFGLCGLDSTYTEARKASFFVVETRTRYRRELTVRDPVRVTLQLVGFDSKRAQYWMEIRHAADGWLAASLRTAVACTSICAVAESVRLPERHPHQPGVPEGGAPAVGEAGRVGGWVSGAGIISSWLAIGRIEQSI